MVGPEATVVRYDPVYGPPRRVVFEPRSDGRYRRSTAHWNGCRWVQTGSECVENVAVTAPAGPDSP